MAVYVAGQERSLERGGSIYLIGQLAAGATQLPISDKNVASEAASANATQAYLGVCILSGQMAGPVPSVSVEVSFPSNPGAGESIALQEADTPVDAAYITPANTAYTISAFAQQSDGTYRARVDLSPTGGRFLRPSRTKGANGVGATVKVTKLG